MGIVGALERINVPRPRGAKVRVAASRELPPMFVVELIYKADLGEIDARMRSHMAFLKKHYAEGRFLVSGRKIPRDGGIILAVANSRDEIEAIMKEDPFCKQGLAEFRVIEFRASQRAADVPKRVEGA
jgi:uncharacterized protein YciI